MPSHSDLGMWHWDQKRTEGQRFVAELAAAAAAVAVAEFAAAAGVVAAVVVYVLQAKTLVAVAPAAVEGDELVVGVLVEDKVFGSSAGTAIVQAGGTVLR